jgi:O-antigen/teichoic acid export membrane protein
MCIGLYTSRIVLRELGVEDFGINAVVGSLIIICSFITGSLNQTLNRYFSFELGKEDYEKLNKIFNIALILYAAIALISLILAETIGLWFLQNKMVIPPERANAALWVYEFSVMSMCLSLMLTPYMSIVISMERFKLFAYMSIFDAVMKLAVVYSLMIIDFDKLKLFSVLNFSVNCLVFIIYKRYSTVNFKETAFKFCKEWSLYKDLLKFSGWMLLNPISYTAKYQGVNVVLNLFFGPTINAANGIASRVMEAIASFIGNAMQAVNPQIIKLYASENFNDMWSLVIRASKMYYLLFFVLALPVIANAEFVLSTWLGNVPDYAVIFTQLVLIEQIVRTIFLASVQVNNASENIKIVQIIGCIVQTSNLPIAIALCYLGFDATSIFIAGILIMTLNVFSVGFVIKIQNGLPTIRFLQELFLPIIKVTLLSIIIPYIMHYFLSDDTLFSLLNITACVVFGCGSSYYFGLNSNEREKVIDFVKRKLSPRGS